MKDLICLIALLFNPVAQVILFLIFIACILPRGLSEILCSIIAVIIVLFVIGLVIQLFLTLLK